MSPGVSYTFRFHPVWSRFGLIAARKSVCRVPRRIAKKVAGNSNVRVKRNKSRDVGQHENNPHVRFKTHYRRTDNHREHRNSRKRTEYVRRRYRVSNETIGTSYGQYF